jgi:tetratricopeptide (TPR) repeat protein
VGEHLGYADTALVQGSPGEALRAMEKGMAAGIVPSAGSNQEIAQEAKTAVARDRRDLPKDAQTAAKDPQGEFDVKVGLGFYSLGEWEEAVEAVKRGLGKGGVKRIDDANLLLGASLVELGRYDEAKQAFAAAAGAAGSNEFMRRVAGLWSAYADRKSGGTGAG